MRRALVLGGGGTVGIAWGTGVLAGLGRSGVDVSNAELVVGTSAGSVVGTQLALGIEVDALLTAQLAPPDPLEARPLAVGQRSFGAAVQLLGQTVNVTPAVLSEVGRLALAAATVDEAAYLQPFALLVGLPWPTGSCAVPGISPSVTIRGWRYMYGGMRSKTKTDFAAGYEWALIGAPIGPGGG